MICKFVVAVNNVITHPLSSYLFYSDCQIKEEAPQAKSDEDALWLWNESVKWTKLDKEE